MGHLLAVVQQVVQALLDVGQRPVHRRAQLFHTAARQFSQALCELGQLRHILPYAPDEPDHGQSKFLVGREKCGADVVHQRRLGASQHGFYGLRRRRLDDELFFHAPAPDACIGNLFQHPCQEAQVLRKLGSALNGPLSKQGIERG